MCRKRFQSGLSLIEMVVFIIVLAIGFTGLVVLYNQMTTASVDPVVRKQVLAIATSLLEEIQLRGFTYCDPDDANVYTATSATVGVGAGQCATKAEAPPFGPDASPVNESGRSLYDNVNDYHGFQMLSGITDITGSTVPGLGAYQVTGVSVSSVGTSAPFSLADNDDALSISVTVTGPAGVSVTLEGYRLRYAPNSH
jgi:MSHA pilin protein MshD